MVCYVTSVWRVVLKIHHLRDINNDTTCQTEVMEEEVSSSNSKDSTSTKNCCTHTGAIAPQMSLLMILPSFFLIYLLIINRLQFDFPWTRAWNRHRLQWRPRLRPQRRYAWCHCSSWMRVQLKTPHKESDQRIIHLYLSYLQLLQQLTQLYIHDVRLYSLYFYPSLCFFSTSNPPVWIRACWGPTS